MYFELYNVIYLPWFNIILLRSGNIHPNPGPVANQFNFCHWNLNGLMAHDKLKLALIEAYNAVYHYDVIGISETFLNSKINDSDICIQGFSHDVFRKDHPNDTSRGGVCLYYRENLPITRVKNLEILDEAIVCQISIKRKNVYFLVVYRSPSQTADEFNLFLDRLELIVENIQAKKPDCIIITGDFNCRTQQWWSGDIEDHHGPVLDDLIQSKNLSQLIDEPTHIINDSSPCIDLIITSQPFLFVEHGIHPSLFKNCHHKIVHGKLNLSVPPPPVFKRKLWDYNNADIDALHDKLRCVDSYAVFRVAWMST